MKKKKTLSGLEMIESDLTNAFKHYHRLEPNISVDEKIRKSVETVTHYVLSDLNQASLNLKNKITDILWDMV